MTTSLIFFFQDTYCFIYKFVFVSNVRQFACKFLAMHVSKLFKMLHIRTCVHAVLLVTLKTEKII